MVRVLSSIEPQHGFHRTFTTSIASDSNWVRAIEEYQCSVHLYYRFPVLVFVDPYELANYHELYSFEHYGNANLELPVAAMDTNGTSLLLTLSESLLVRSQLEIQVPVHLRYGEISHSNKERHRTADIAWPELIISCSSPGKQTAVVTFFFF